MTEFRDRVAVVTGGASGIGLAMATAFAERGAKIVLADIDEVALAERKMSFSDRGTGVLAVRTDVRDRASVEALADTTWREFGGAHIVCNNAGIAPFGSVIGADPRDWKLTMDINFWGVVHGVDAFAPRMIEQNEAGHIVNTASMAGLTGMLGLGVYCASKFALEALAEVLQYEVGSFGIDSVIVQPGPFPTRLLANSPAPADVGRVEAYGDLGHLREGFHRQFEDFFASKETTDPQEVAEAITNLISLPAGKRPLRTVCGPDYGAVLINEHTAPIQAETLNALGMGSMFRP